MATTLPLELIQSILLQTDPETYLSAHQTCRAWRRASSAPYMLRHAIQQIPASLVPPLHYASPSPSPSDHPHHSSAVAKTTKARKGNTTTTTTTGTENLTPEQWTAYYAQTARLNLLSRRRNVRKSVTPCRSVVALEQGKGPLSPGSSTVKAISDDGRTLVVLRGAMVLVYRAADGDGIETRVWESESESESEFESDSTTSSPRDKDECEFHLDHEFPLVSSLYPHWTSVCRALMDQSINAGNMSVNRRYAKHRVAVSSRGEFVAVALGRVIQVYGVGRRSSSRPVGSDQGEGQGERQCRREGDLPSANTTPAEHVLGQNAEHIAFARPSDPTHYEDTDGVVEGLEFADDDALLRVAIGKESTIHRPTRVRYLGCPEGVGHRGLDMGYWREAIKKVYLDSAALGVSFIGGGARCDLRGLRLLGRGVVDVRDQWDASYSHSHSSSSSPSTPNTTEPERPNRRYFISSIQTNSTDTYCIGQITSSPATMSLLRLLPSIYNRPNSILPITPQTKDYPCLYAYPHRPDTTTATTTSTNTQSQSSSQPNKTHAIKSTHSYKYNLQTTLPRFTSTNLPSGTFSAPKLAVSDDAQVLVIYEPDHACCVVEGGALYVVYVGGCRSVYQPSFSSLSSSSYVGVEGGDEDSDADENENTRNSNTDPTQEEPEGREEGGRGGGKYPLEDIVPTWPFLLDRVSVDMESVKVKRVEGKKGGCKYKVTGTAGDEEMEWMF